MQTSASAGHNSRPRHALPGEARRARQSLLPLLSNHCLSEYRSLQSAFQDLSPSFHRDLNTAGLFAKPVVDTIDEEINRRISDPNVVDAMPKADELEAARVSLRQRRQAWRKSPSNPIMSQFRMKNWIGAKQIQSQIDSRPDAGEVAAGTDFLVTMVVFHHKIAHFPVQELQMLGSNTLQDAADALACVLERNAPALRDVMPSSYFLIEDRFYDNQSATGAEPISQLIIDWVREERRFAHQNLGAFRRGRAMHLAPLSEINFRPGSIYHYTHLGACRHAIMFTNVAILSEGDLTKRSAYPLQTALIKERRQQCGACETNAADFATYGDRLASTNPFLYCSDCYYAMHYSEDGHLLYDGFKVYPYICDY